MGNFFGISSRESFLHFFFLFFSLSRGSRARDVLIIHVDRLSACVVRLKSRLRVPVGRAKLGRFVSTNYKVVVASDFVMYSDVINIFASDDRRAIHFYYFPTLAHARARERERILAENEIIDARNDGRRSSSGHEGSRRNSRVRPALTSRILMTRNRGEPFRAPSVTPFEMVNNQTIRFFDA